MTFWDWAVAAYANPEVAEACLSLQDEHGQNVPLLLWAGWLARQGARADVSAGAALSRSWEAQVVGPVRSARRALREPHPPIPDSAREALRDRIKAAELQAERALMDALESLAEPAETHDLLASLEAAARAWNGEVPRPALARLAASL